MRACLKVFFAIGSVLWLIVPVLAETVMREYGVMPTLEYLYLREGSIMAKNRIQVSASTKRYAKKASRRKLRRVLKDYDVVYAKGNTVKKAFDYAWTLA